MKPEERIFPRLLARAPRDYADLRFFKDFHLQHRPDLKQSVDSDRHQKLAFQKDRSDRYPAGWSSVECIVGFHQGWVWQAADAGDYLGLAYLSIKAKARKLEMGLQGNADCFCLLATSVFKSWHLLECQKPGTVGQNLKSVS